MRLQLPTPAVPDPPRSEVGGVGPRLTNRLDAEPPVSNGKGRLFLPSEAAARECRADHGSQGAPDQTTRFVLNRTVRERKNLHPRTVSAVPADESQELPESDAPSNELDQAALVSDAAVVNPQGVATPVASDLNASASAGSSSSTVQLGCTPGVRNRIWIRIGQLQ